MVDATILIVAEVLSLHDFGMKEKTVWGSPRWHRLMTYVGLTKYVAGCARRLEAVWLCRATLQFMFAKGVELEVGEGFSPANRFCKKL